MRVHFVHQHRAGDRLPLVLTHGWPSTFVELLPLVDRLGDRFDLVVPSLPGYAFSPRPPRTGVDRAFVAGLWHELMQGLGYERYGAHGGDFGAGVATYMALSQPDRVVGIHLSTPEMSPYTGPGAPPLSAEEQAYVEHVARWDETERGYSAVQSTRPQTLGYGLNDSPAGLAAWVLDKWRSWSDSGGDLDARFGRDALLTMLTVWWATGSITSSMRDYYDNRWHGTPIGPDDRVRVPTAMAVFANEFVPEGEPPRSWYERLYDDPPLDGVPPWRALRRGRGARPAGRTTSRSSSPVRSLVGADVGRGTRIRTGGLPLPKRTRYQAAPYPAARLRTWRTRGTGSRLRCRTAPRRRHRSEPVRAERLVGQPDLAGRGRRREEPVEDAAAVEGQRVLAGPPREAAPLVGRHLQHGPVECARERLDVAGRHDSACPRPPRRCRR